MRTYDKLFKILIGAMIIAGSIQVFSIFFDLPRTPEGAPYIGVPIFNFGFQWESFLIILNIPVAIYLWHKKPLQAELLPDIAIMYGLLQILMILPDNLSPELFPSLIQNFVPQVGIIIFAFSFRRGLLHCQTRIMLLICVIIQINLVALMLVIYMDDQTGRFYVKLLIQIVEQYHIFLFIVLGFAIIPMCLFPKDFPGPRLSDQLKDIEYTMTNKPEMYIKEEDLAKITGADMSEWHESKNPLIDREISVHIHGQKADIVLNAQKWKGEDGIYLSFVSRRDATVSWGQGAKLVYVADDNTVSSIKGRAVRLYTDDGFFYRLVVYYIPPVIRHRYRTKIERFFEDF